MQKVQLSRKTISVVRVARVAWGGIKVVAMRSTEGKRSPIKKTAQTRQNKTIQTLKFLAFEPPPNHHKKFI